MNVRYRVDLTQYERAALEASLSRGKQPARKLKRAQILLAADAGVSDEDIAVSVGVGGPTVYRTKRRFVEGPWHSDAARGHPPHQNHLIGGGEQLVRHGEAEHPGGARAAPP